MSQLILKRAPVGDNQDDFDVLDDGVVVCRISFLDAVGPQGPPWMRASGHNGDIERAAYGYEQTREAAMAVFAKNLAKGRRPPGQPGAPKWGWAGLPGPTYAEDRATDLFLLWSTEPRLSAGAFP